MTLEDTVDRHRLGRACLLVVVPLLAIALWGSIVEPEGGEEPLSAEACLRQEGEAPAWFVEEVLDVGGTQELRANGDWSVVSFVAEGERCAVASALAADLESRGWMLMESGQEGVLTGVKEGGRCPWMALSCTEVGEMVCVVVQVPAPAS
ncbi:hypothetical protein [Adlercreutzia shanghongiae]|uniref:Uncharacterized protein n=1 Tax=Adlercreutzia shanghongiae TaxID=3111773 RepID=A0ABU6J035_9ACTN|nr:hypothetical protein [Adlercreutzia sp. R22]MEC4295373.1 hypothetical protein [Adlercreutzia sp. R22]